MTKKKLKPLKIILIILAVIIGLFLLLLVGIRVGSTVVYKEFYSNADWDVRIPDLDNGYIPQGIDYLEDKEYFLSCGYMSGKQSSRVYVTPPLGESYYSQLKNPDGSDYLGHTGGLAHFGDYIYITGNDGLDVFSFEDIIKGREAKMIGNVKTFNDPAYCHIHNNKIYCGSFYRKGNYETPQWERITTPSGDENTAVITVFELDENAEYGINPKPTAVISTCGLVQGMCFTDDEEIVLSTSYGMATSHLYFYNLDLTKEAENKVTLGENNEYEAPLYFLDISKFIKAVTAPPMSEEIIFVNKRIYIMNESASNKYIFGKFMQGYKLWGYKDLKVIQPV